MEFCIPWRNRNEKCVLTGICAGRTDCGALRQVNCSAEPQKKALGLTDFQVITEPGGKPRIAGHDAFHYNLSHSGLRVAIAWGSSPVGVDVQQMRPDIETEELARRFFTADEQAYIFEQPELTMLRFYRVWTEKESYLKYLGTGLKKSLTSFSVLDPKIARLLQFRYLPDGYCVSFCSSDSNCVFELEDQPFQ